MQHTSHQPQNEAMPALGHNNPPSELELLKERLEDNGREAVMKLSALPQAPEVIQNEEEAGKATEVIKGVIAIKKDIESVHKKVKAPYLQCGKEADAWKNRHHSKADEVRSHFEKPLKAFLARKEEEERQRLLEVARKEQEEAERLAERERREAEALAAEASEHSQEGIEDTAQELMSAALEKEAVADSIIAYAHSAPAAKLAKARAAHGQGTASSKGVWVGEIEFIQAIDLEALRPYLAKDAIQKAVNAFVKAGNRSLRGVKIHQQTKLNIR